MIWILGSILLKIYHSQLMEISFWDNSVTYKPISINFCMVCSFLKFWKSSIHRPDGMDSYEHQLFPLGGYDLSVFLAATKQLYEWFSPFVCPSVCPSVRPSVRPSVCLSHLFDYVPIIVSLWNFQELLPVTKVTSMQKVKVRGQRSRSQRSQPNWTLSGL